MSKRIFDVLISGFGLVLFLPILLFIMLLIVVFDGGNPFFIQQRIGKNKKRFFLIKFKTMVSGKKWERDDFQVGQTSRITPLGNVLRKTKLDELPQLVNVLKGDMSLVGPRPEVEKWTLVYPEKWQVVHSVKPGITDNASLLFKNEEDILAATAHPEDTYRNIILPQKLELYTRYVYTQSFSGDFKIILNTIKSIWLEKKSL